MNLTRRNFAKLAAATGTVVVLPVSGCAVNALSIAQSFLAAAQAVYAVDPTIPDLEQAIVSLKTVIANWTTGSSTCVLIAAANDVSAILDTIAPASSVFAIAAVAVAGFDALINALAPCVQTTAKAVRTHVSRVRGTPEYQAHLQAFKHAWFPQRSFVSACNRAAKQSGFAVRIS